MTKKGNININTFGFKSVDSRMSTFKGRIASYKREANYVIKKAQMRKEYLNREVEKYEHLLKEFTEKRDECVKNTQNLLKQGKVKIDAKRGKALIKRGLEDLFGIVESPTLLYCTKNIVRLDPLLWADKWAADLLDAISEQKFKPEYVSMLYDEFSKCKTKEEVRTHLALTVLGRKQYATKS